MRVITPLPSAGGVGGEASYRQGIVEVLRIGRVDGEGKHIAEVLAAGYLLRRDAGVDFVGSLLHALRIFVGQAVLGKDGVHLHVVIALLAKYIDDLSDEVLRLLRRPLRDFHHSLLARFAAFQFFLRYEHVLSEDVAFRNEEGVVLLHLQDTHGLVVLALKNLGDDGLLDVVLAARHHRYADAVAAHGRHRIPFTDKDGLAAIVGHERILSVGFADECTLLYLRLQVQPVAVVVHLAQIVVPCHLLHRVHGQHLSRMRVKLQCLEDVLEIQGLARMCLKKGLYGIGHLALRQAPSSFFLSHTQ